MKLVKQYTELTTEITIYQDAHGNEFMYEDGELHYTNIFGIETNYDSSGMEYPIV